MSRIVASSVRLALGAAVALVVACGPAAPAAAPAPTAAPKQAVAQPTAAGATAPAQKAMQEAQARGLKFVASHDELVAKANQEGSVKALTSLAPETIKAVKEQWAKAYPNTKLDLVELSGTDAQQRFLLELKSGAAADWDLLSVSQDDFPEYVDHIDNFDVMGMAEQKVLAFDPKMVYPRDRNMVVTGSIATVVAYNKNQVSADKLPKTWEDLLKPEWRGRQMLAEIRTNNIAALAPALGEEWVKDYGKKLAAQDPIWARGNTRALTAMNAGEYALHSATYYHSAQDIIRKGAGGLETHVVEPVPVHMSLAYGVQKNAKHPHAALLLMEYLAGSEGQKLLDEVEYLKGSVFDPNSKLSKLIAGKRASIVDWEWWPKMAKIQETVSEAYGLPKAEVRE